MFRKLTVALLALIMSVGLAGLVAGEAAARPNPTGPGKSWIKETNRVDITVWTTTTSRPDNRGHGPRSFGQAPTVVITDRWGGVVAHARKVGTQNSGRSVGYRYVVRNLPWNTAFTVKVWGEGSFYGDNHVYLKKPWRGGVVTDSVTLHQAWRR